MFKKIALIVTLVILLGVSAALTGVFATNKSNWENYKSVFTNEKTTSVKSYFDAMLRHVMTGVESHAYWTQSHDNLLENDTQWLDENATGYITEMELFHIDYILVATENLDYIAQWNGDYKHTVLNLPSVQKSLEQDTMEYVFTRVQEQYMLVVSAPFKNNDYLDPTGVYVAVVIFDKEEFEEMNTILGLDQTIDDTIFTSDGIHLKGEPYHSIAFYLPIYNSDFAVQILYKIRDNNRLFTAQRNYIVITIILAAASVNIILLLFVRQMMSRIVHINDAAKEISQGNYDQYLKLTPKEFFTEIGDLAHSVDKIREDIKHNLSIIDNNYLEMTEVIANAVSVNDSYTYEHNKIVGDYAKIIATEIGYENIDDIYLAAKLHDIGKISIPGTILNKQGKLTEAEYALIKTHPEQGYNIIKNIDYFSHIRLGIKHHHEHWDGTGYPDRLKGDEIPLIAPIITIADVYDALTSDRSYRKALSHEEAVHLIVSNSAKQFNPLLVKAFINKSEVFESTLQTQRRH